MTPEQKLLLVLSKTDPAGEEDKDIAGSPHSIDYQTLLDLASLNQVTPLLYRNIRNSRSLPGDVLDSLEKVYFATFKSNIQHSREVLRLIRLLQEAGIEAVPLKGSLFSDIVLGDMGLYPTSDIDLLVRPHELERAKHVLVVSGYIGDRMLSEEDQRQGSYHLRLSNNIYVVELHWNLVKRYFEAPPDFWWEDAGTIEYEGTKIPVLAPERYLLYAIFRLFSHGFIPLRFSILVSGIIGKYRGQLDWSKFLSCAQKLKMTRVSLFTLKLLHELLGLDIPQEIANRRVFGYDFLKGIVVRGLFKGVRRPRLRMAIFTVLMDTPPDTLRVLLRRIFPDLSEIRLRYGLPAKSKLVYIYYLLNPILLATRKRERQ